MHNIAKECIFAARILNSAALTHVHSLRLNLYRTDFPHILLFLQLDISAIPVDPQFRSAQRSFFSSAAAHLVYKRGKEQFVLKVKTGIKLNDPTCLSGIQANVSHIPGQCYRISKARMTTGDFTLGQLSALRIGSNQQLRIFTANSFRSLYSPQVIRDLEMEINLWSNRLGHFTICLFWPKILHVYT